MTRTSRWDGAVSLSLLAVALGVVTGRPALLVAASVPLALGAVTRARAPPEPTLTVSRDVSERTPRPGEDVRVSLRVRNDGDRTLRSLRFADDVPRGLDVVDGSPERATPLRPDATATVEYVVTAARGRHEFDALTVRTGAPPSGRERRTTVRADPVTVECVPRLDSDPRPPRRAVARLAGTAPSPGEGAGTEFSSVREYHRGDPVSHIDWRGWAKRGEPTTVAFRAERTARVVLVVDARAAAYVAPDPAGPPAVDRCVAAARSVAGGLLSAGHRVGVAALSPRPCRIGPGAGSGHRARLERALALSSAFDAAPPPNDAAGDDADAVAGDDADRDARAVLDGVRRWLPGDARVVVCSPLTDDGAVDAARRLAGYGHEVAVLSPDPTTVDSPVARFARAERDRRLTALRSRGITVVDVPFDADPGDALRRRAP
ncbi:DUF58 domain-containing protein [Halobaculum sp. P14]|uniref:DUF58 domain-containing protein n=1 Tax=Halobaculum sp. P14 TaxID=3421638 RepID=UPI003EB95A16